MQRKVQASTLHDQSILRKVKCDHQGPRLSSAEEPTLSVLSARMVTLTISSAARYGFRSKAFVFLSLPGLLLPLEGKEET